MTLKIKNGKSICKVEGLYDASKELNKVLSKIKSKVSVAMYNKLLSEIDSYGLDKYSDGYDEVVRAEYP